MTRISSRSTARRTIPEKVTDPSPDKAVNGRQRLMQAALELAASTRSLASLGLREVARHAGLNPNTFYRHFKDFDDLGLAMLGDLGTELRRGLRGTRVQAAAQGVHLSDIRNVTEGLAHAQKVIGESVGLVFDFVTHNKAAYVVSIRELHGSSPRLRQAMRQLLDDIAADMAEDVLGVLKLPLVAPEIVGEISRMVVRQMTVLSMEYLEDSPDRDNIRRQAERFILLLFWGAIAAQAPGLIAASKVKFPD